MCHSIVGETSGRGERQLDLSSMPRTSKKMQDVEACQHNLAQSSCSPAGAVRGGVCYRVHPPPPSTAASFSNPSSVLSEARSKFLVNKPPLPLASPRHKPPMEENYGRSKDAGRNGGIGGGNITPRCIGGGARDVPEGAAERNIPRVLGGGKICDNMTRSTGSFFAGNTVLQARGDCNTLQLTARAHSAGISAGTELRN